MDADSLAAVEAQAVIYAPPIQPPPLYPERIGAEVRIVIAARKTAMDKDSRRMRFVAQPGALVVEWEDGTRGICDMEELK